MPACCIYSSMACTDTSEPCTSDSSMESKQVECLHAGVVVDMQWHNVTLYILCKCMYMRVYDVDGYLWLVNMDSGHRPSLQYFFVRSWTTMGFGTSKHCKCKVLCKQSNMIWLLSCSVVNMQSQQDVRSHSYEVEFERQSPKNTSPDPLNRHGAFRADPHSSADLYRKQTENRCIIVRCRSL